MQNDPYGFELYRMELYRITFANMPTKPLYFFAYYYLGFRVQHETDRVVLNSIFMVNTVFGMDEQLKGK